MKTHDKSGGTITFRHHVGRGTYSGHEFELGVTCAPEGTILGTPVVVWDNDTTVTFELEDIVPTAYEKAFPEEDPRAEVK